MFKTFLAPQQKGKHKGKRKEKKERKKNAKPRKCDHDLVPMLMPTLTRGARLGLSKALKSMASSFEERLPLKSLLLK